MNLDGDRPEPFKGISILTICRNNLQGLQQTVASVSSQTSPPDEFIVLDGASADGTVEYLATARSVTAWKSEPDEGIADAFNKVVRMASGEWVLFLNSGDRLCDADVLGRVREALARCDADVGVAYGHARIVDGETLVGKAQGDHLGLNGDNSLCHQACFIRRDLQLRHPYDVRLRIGMDYDLWFRIGRCARFQPLDLDVALYALGGVSTTRSWAEHSVVAHHFVRWLNSDPRSRLGLREVLSLLSAVLGLRAKKGFESLLGQRRYTLLKKAFRR